MLDNVLKDLDPGQVFKWTGKWDGREGADRLIAAMRGFLLTMEASPSLLPDDRNMHEICAQAAGLPSAASFRLVRAALIKHGWITSGNSPSGPVLMLTLAGRQRVKALVEHMQQRGYLDSDGRPVPQDRINKLKRYEEKDRKRAARKQAKKQGPPET